LLLYQLQKPLSASLLRGQPSSWDPGAGLDKGFRDPVLGDIGETWFSRDGHIFQLSVSAPDHIFHDEWVRDIAANLTFPADGAADASTQQP